MYVLYSYVFRGKDENWREKEGKKEATRRMEMGSAGKYVELEEGAREKPSWKRGAPSFSQLACLIPCSGHNRFIHGSKAEAAHKILEQNLVFTEAVRNYAPQSWVVQK